MARTAFLLALLLATPAAAQDPATDPRCATVRVAIPPAFARWSERQPLAAGTAPRDAPVLVIGRAVDLRVSTGFVPPVAPAKPADAGTRGGLATFQVARAGTYRVALGAPAWIEVTRRGKALASTAHAHGPMCTGLRKIVDFRLTPGRYALQITGAASDTVAAMIVRA